MSSNDRVSIVFLDIDGVLNSTRYYEANKPVPMGKAGAIDPAACAMMNQITDRPGVVVVLSSAWRFQGTVRVAAILKSRGLRAKIIGSTPSLMRASRSNEIVEWLLQADHMGFRWHRYVVIDDDLDAFNSTSTFSTYGVLINTSHIDGITEEGVTKALACMQL